MEGTLGKHSLSKPLAPAAWPLVFLEMLWRGIFMFALQLSGSLACLLATALNCCHASLLLTLCKREQTICDSANTQTLSDSCRVSCRVSFYSYFAALHWVFSPILPIGSKMYFLFNHRDATQIPGRKKKARQEKRLMHVLNGNSALHPGPFYNCSTKPYQLTVRRRRPKSTLFGGGGGCVLPCCHLPTAANYGSPLSLNDHHGTFSNSATGLFSYQTIRISHLSGDDNMRSMAFRQGKTGCAQYLTVGRHFTPGQLSQAIPTQIIVCLPCHLGSEGSS